MKYAIILMSTVVFAQATIALAADRLEDVISIDFAKKEYEYSVAEAAKGIKIDYTLEIRQDFPGLVPRPQGSCAPAGPAGLFPFEVLAGGGQQYALRDRGLCPPPSQVPITIKKATYRNTFEWAGRNWQGPSDTNQPQREPFPPGTYTLEVSMVGNVGTPAGQKPYRVAKTVVVKLKP